MAAATPQTSAPTPIAHKLSKIDHDNSGLPNVPITEESKSCFKEADALYASAMAQAEDAKVKAAQGVAFFRMKRRHSFFCWPEGALSLTDVVIHSA